MRRGHSGVGGWRGDNQRHFRPRGNPLPHFRPPRPFGSHEAPIRYPPLGPRQYRGSHGLSVGHSENAQNEHYDRHQYRINRLPHSYERVYHRDRQPPFHHENTQNDNDHGRSHSESNFYQNINQCHINNMGDIDHRRQHPSPWATSYDNRQYYENRRSPHKTSKTFNVGDDLPDYSGHRPPASDHYTTTTGANINNSQYTHSVNDTVDIIRKRIQNRDKQQTDASISQLSKMDEDLRINTKENCQVLPQEQPVKKRVERQRQNIKLNCNKMKNKIVHQLFKMDKDKIHKLLDNPSSSTKFEYAISSLITESENSLKRHIRSVAEKSLCSSSTDFIQDDHNTIYEDTFMKQMQGVLDPQDTVLLEDIKPIVMAELSRVLQLDDYQFEALHDYGMNQDIQDQSIDEQSMHDHDLQNQGFETSDTDIPKEEPTNYQYYDEVHTPVQHSPHILYEDYMADNDQNNTDIIYKDYQNDYQDSSESKPLFERRPLKRVDCPDQNLYLETTQLRKSIDEAFGHRHTKSSRANYNDCAPPAPLFDPNVDQLSDDDDDPFAELDKQYHVAVDRDFIENTSRPPSPPQSYPSNTEKSLSFSGPTKTIDAPSLTINSTLLKKEIDSQIHQIAEASENIAPYLTNKTDKDIARSSLEKENLLTSIRQVECHIMESAINKESTKKKEVEKQEKSCINKPVAQGSKAHKRMSEQKPSHRKEKRKRSSHSECDDTSNTISNMFCIKKSGTETPKILKTPDSSYSEKYVKRKNSHKKSNEKDINVNESNKDIASSHSNVSPKENVSNESSSKSESKTKLKSIDMFSEHTKKANIHQAYRNTAQTLIVTSPDDSKPKPVVATATSFTRKLSKKHVGTQVILKYRTKNIQTDKPKQCDRHIQTDVPDTSKSIATNPLERMKEIDMEIQLLLQEKFKLYNSIETKSIEIPMDTIPNLSMRVFKVNTDQVAENSIESEDAIVENFMNIPTEELEQIALETVENENNAVISSTKSRRKKVSETVRKSSESPTTKRNNKKTKTPNISLIEQIITENRPIEDIISLDDLESSPVNVKSKKRQQRTQPKKKNSKQLKSSKPVGSVSIDTNINLYDIKECSVVIRRSDIDNYFKAKSNEQIIKDSENNHSDNHEEQSLVTEIMDEEEIHKSELLEPDLVQEVEEVVNDIQFDMLDVSEDIIIGDNCEVKADGKSIEREAICEEIILDNSQSSLEETACPNGAENECKMYDYSTNETLRRDAITVTGNADAVLAIECIDNDFIAACLDGNVYYFNGDGQLLKTLRGTNQAVTCLTIVQEKYGTTVYTGSLDSRIRYYDLETGIEKGPECNVLSPIQTMDRAWDTIFVGTRTGFVLQFECKNNMLIPVSTVKFAEQSILALRAMKEGPRKVLLVASRSENVVTIKDAQTGLLLRTLQGPKMSVYTLLFEDGKVYCGTSSYNVHVFDYSSGAHVMSHEGGKGAVCLRAAGGLVFAGCYDGCVYVFREGEVRPRAQLRGPSVMLLSLAILGTKIIAGYKDRGLYIWKLPLAIVQEMIL